MAVHRRFARVSLGVAVAGTVVATLAACTGGAETMQSAQGPAAPTQAGGAPATQPKAGPVTAAPTTPPAKVCGSQGILNGPAAAPDGAVTVPAGDNANVDLNQANTTYWFAPGVHTLGTGEFANIVPADNDAYIGAPGAILDGQHKNDSAFDGTAEHVLIQNLTIRNFGTFGGNSQEGVVNHDSGSYWTISHSTIADNAGAGAMVGSHNTLTWNCLQDNQQYGFNAYSNNGEITDLVLDHNEIAGNDTFDYEAKQPGCGCSGGGKFWDVVNAKVTSNWVHDNKSVGLWADTNNAGFEFAGNYISNSQGVGLMYEISYNAVIQYNTFERNGVTGGPASTGFPTSAIYISESGTDSRVNSNYKNSPLLIAHNVFLNNWGGVILWENSNRFCASPDNTSSGYCTVVNPKVTLKTCGNAALVKTQPYLADCRWKTQNALVEFNQFTFTPSAVGKSCTAARLCGYNGVFSEYGSDPSWSPYHADIVPTAIAFHQNNKFSNNTYSGPWCFMGWELGTSVGFNQWQAAANASSKQFGQDASSVHTGASGACS
jgi:Right handed beta helix region